MWYESFVRGDLGQLANGRVYHRALDGSVLRQAILGTGVLIRSDRCGHFSPIPL